MRSRRNGCGSRRLSGRGLFRFGRGGSSLEVTLPPLSFLRLIVLLAHIVFTSTLYFYSLSTMTFRLNRFNTILAFLLVLSVVSGCQTEQRKKKHAVTTLQVHLDCSPYETDRNQFIAIPREHPTKICIEKESILTEAHVASAKVISEMDGFVINIQLDHRGQLILEQYTGANHGHRLAIYAQFGENLSTNRWLAAPIISHVIKDGSLTFTPDATRAEADQIVLGLNNVAKKVDEMDR